MIDTQDDDDALWQVIMQDRPDLIVSELSGLAFDSLQQAFRPGDLDIMFSQPTPPSRFSEAIYIAIDPAAGGPQSDYALVSITRHKGIITVTRVFLAAQIQHADAIHQLGARVLFLAHPHVDAALEQVLVKLFRLVVVQGHHASVRCPDL